jgi:hypothetical protein
MNIVVYDVRREPCKICELRDSILLPTCEINGEQELFPICLECRDRLPYKVVPIESGEYFLPKEGYSNQLSE